MLIAPPTKEDFDIAMNRVLVVGGNRLTAYQRADRADAAVMAQAQDNLNTCWFEQYDRDTGRFVQAIDIRR